MNNNALRRFTYSLMAAVTCYTFTQWVVAAEYNIDPEHTFVQFQISHLGYSTLVGRFNKVSGNFSWDAANPGDSQTLVEVDTTSVDTNHAERDKHLRSDEFLDVEKFPHAKFKSTKYSGDDKGGTLDGELTLHGVTRPITLEVKFIGEGKDPWGGYRAGFSGTTSITRSDFDMAYDLGSAAESMQLNLFVEGIRK